MSSHEPQLHPGGGCVYVIVTCPHLAVGKDLHSFFHSFSRYASSSYCTQFSSYTCSCPTLCDHLDYSPPGSSVHGILQAKILEWVTMLPDPGIEPTSLMSPALAGRFFTTSATWNSFLLTWFSMPSLSLSCSRFIKIVSGSWIQLFRGCWSFKLDKLCCIP